MLETKDMSLGKALKDETTADAVVSFSPDIVADGGVVGEESLGSASVETVSKGSLPPSPSKRTGSVSGWEVDLNSQVTLSKEMLSAMLSVVGVPVEHHIHSCYREGGCGSYYHWLLEEENRIRAEEEAKAEEERLKAATEKEKRKKRKSKKKKA